jgi:tetratricopeptide (TPR) repeat protein
MAKEIVKVEGLKPLKEKGAEGYALKDEDNLIIEALLYQEVQDYKKTAAAYKKLYQLTHKKLYLHEAIAHLTFIRDFDSVEELIRSGAKRYPDDLKLLRYEIGVLLDKKEYKKAETNINKILKMDRSSHSLTIAATIAKLQKKYKQSKKYFDEAYKKDGSERTFLSMLSLVYNEMGKKKEAKKMIKGKIKKDGCTQQYCYFLLDIYAKEKDTKGMMKVYKQLYKKYKNFSYAKKVVELYVYEKDKKSAINYIKKNDLGEDLLIDVYVTLKEYKTAYNLAEKIYKKSKDYNYYGKMAMFEYEGAEKKSKKVLESVSKKFAVVVEKLDDELYYNYYGYLLIDHDMDYKKGIALVKKALQKDPNSYYYIDSLAWGYYKTGQCKKALVEIEKAYAISKDQEIVEHREKIKECSKQK